MSSTNLSNEGDNSAVTKEQLIEDFKVVAADVEALLSATVNQGGEAFSSLRNKAEQSLARAKIKMAETQDVLIEKGKVAANATDEFVHENPWKAIGVSAGIGLVVGLLIGRR